MNGPGVFLVSSIFWLRDESLEESDWGRSGRLRSRFKPFNTFKPLKAFGVSDLVSGFRIVLRRARVVS
jgi:hypothetical protein